MIKQTAVEWFAKQLGITSGTMLEQAKAMEREQIEHAWDLGRRDIDYSANGEQYYKQTYKGGEQ